MSARRQLLAFVEVESDEQVDELVRLAANAEIGLSVEVDPGIEKGSGDPACPNCLCAHGPLDVCALGVLAGVVKERWEGLDDRPEITPALLEGIHADYFWDLLYPAVDWLEGELRQAAS
jgi:hypothetical protein